MNKNDLKNGMIVEFRNKTYAIVVSNSKETRNKFILVSDKLCWDSTSYSMDLTNFKSKEYDIIKIFQRINSLSNNTATIIECIANHSIWERTN